VGNNALPGRLKGKPVPATYDEDADKKKRPVEPAPTEADIDEEVRKFIAGEPSMIARKNVEPRAEEEPFEILRGYEYVEATPRTRKPMTPELQAILDDAKAAWLAWVGEPLGARSVQISAGPSRLAFMCLSRARSCSD
jgi:hypothetical protein